MASQLPRPREQEHSIRERKRLLFEDDEPRAEAAPDVPRKSFVEYLQTTPAAPLSTAEKAILWGVGVVVVLLLLAALFLGTR